MIWTAVVYGQMFEIARGIKHVVTALNAASTAAIEAMLEEGTFESFCGGLVLKHP